MIARLRDFAGVQIENPSAKAASYFERFWGMTRPLLKATYAVQDALLGGLSFEPPLDDGGYARQLSPASPGRAPEVFPFGQVPPKPSANATARSIHASSG